MTSFFVRYNLGGKTYETTSPSSDGLKVDVVFDGERLTAAIDAADGVTIDKFWVDIPYAYNANKRCFVNGYQSWSDSKEYAVDGHMDTFSRLAEWGVKSVFMRRTGLGRAGETFWREYPRKTGVFYGFSYGYVREGDKYDLFASLSEREGYTIVTFDVSAGIVRIEKDLEGETFGGRHKVLDAVVLSGSHDEVFDRWFDVMGVKCSTIGRKSGYTTWYNYYGGVTQAIVERDLKALAEMPQKVDIFQIDDGYESKVGDWLAVDPVKFPNGMKPMADAIHGKGYLAGIWVAPFAAEFKAAVVKEHPEWLLKGENGKPVIGGFAWNGFYVLDHEKPEVRAYVKKVFDTAIDEWGFDMFKLDFLYAACMIPRGGKSRGRLMHEAMAFLRECVRDKLLLGCGVPMTSSFGFVDACRTGCDAELSFRDRYYVKCTNSEIISTRNSIIDTVFRRHLNDRVFLSDPDVFFLRDGGMKRTDYTQSQKEILARVNKMCGSVLFVSDDPGEYDAKQRAILLDAYLPLVGRILSADMKKDAIRMVFEEKGVEKAFEFDLSTGEYTVRALK